MHVVVCLLYNGVANGQSRVVTAHDDHFLCLQAKRHRSIIVHQFTSDTAAVTESVVPMASCLYRALHTRIMHLKRLGRVSSFIHTIHLYTWRL